ncbi:MAG: FAD-dependent oxidoreductase [Planctomycetes bacterium]|nr:FAD-dependent oxidoreductase [Planctomycetota bacterium]
MIYDTVIIGGGPAAITSAIYTARKGVSFFMIAKDIGGQTNWTMNIENYPGFNLITGAELSDKFREHLEQFKIDLKEDEDVKSVQKQGEIIKIATDKNSYEARSVIIASGREPRKLGVKGEEELLNKGVAYCSTCDAPLFFGKDVAVIGGGNSALEAVLELMRIAGKIYLIHRSAPLKADSVMVEKAKQSGKVTIFTDAKTLEISGNKSVESVKIEHEGAQKSLAVQGVFIEVGSVPLSGIVEGVAKNKEGEIMVNCKCETSVPGIFAAGDVTNVSAKQIVIACGEGAKAAIAAFEYVSRLSM